MRRSKEDMERLVPILRESIHYEPDTGLFTWKRTQRVWFEMGLLQVPVTEKRKPTSSKILPRRDIRRAS